MNLDNSPHPPPPSVFVPNPVALTGPEESRSAADERQAPAARNASITVRLLPVAAWMWLIFALSSRDRLPELLGPTFTGVAGHLAVYAVLAALLWFGLAPWRLAPVWRLTLAFAVAVVFGVSDEWRQAFVPGRTPTLIDVVMDALGALGGLVVVSLWAWKRDRAAADVCDESIVDTSAEQRV